MNIIEKIENKGYKVEMENELFCVYDGNNKLVARYVSNIGLKGFYRERIKLRELAIEQHRKMWKWISRQIMKDYKEQCSIKTISEYKNIYVENNFKNKHIRNNCFCCNYLFNQYDYCCCEDNCPLYWNAENTEKLCTKGYYGSMNEIFNNSTILLKDKYIICEEVARRLSKIAYKIAMLEERKDNV